MQVTLLGTGDTTGTPTPGCDCGTCQRAVEGGMERTRFSIHVLDEETGRALLIDCSPDLRYQFLRDDVRLPDAAIISHIHFDHLDGLGNAYRLVDQLDVYAAGEPDPATGESVAETVSRRYDYLDRVSVTPTAPFEWFEPLPGASLACRLVPVDHPPLVCYGLVVTDGDGMLAVTGDTSYAIPERSRDAFRGADLLLADAIAPASFCDSHPVGGSHPDATGTPRTFGTKHMTREGALSLAGELDTGRVRLVHISHFYSPDEAFEEPLAVDAEQYSI
ncbi:MAG: MBL fold metallo-hydrolase [Halobacteriaceae archaeon]